MITRFLRFTLPFLLMGVLGFMISSCTGEFGASATDVVGWVQYGDGPADNVTGERPPVEGATVSIRDYYDDAIVQTTTAAKTNADGYYEFLAIKASTYDVTFEVDPTYEVAERREVISFANDVQKGTRNWGVTLVYETLLRATVSPFKTIDQSDFLHVEMGGNYEDGVARRTLKYSISAGGDIVVTFNQQLDTFPASPNSWLGFVNATTFDGKTYTALTADIAAAITANGWVAGDTVTMTLNQTATTPYWGAGRSMGGATVKFTLTQ